MPPGVSFRANVGAVVIDSSGRVLALERADVRGAWQLPQGGLDEKEEPADAVLRELREETGIHSDALSLLDEHPEWLAYELPEELRSERLGRGQVQKWFLFRFEGEDRDIDLTDAETVEFRAWRWMRLSDLARETIGFRQPIYQKLVAGFARYLAS